MVAISDLLESSAPVSATHPRRLVPASYTQHLLNDNLEYDISRVNILQGNLLQEYL